MTQVDVNNNNTATAHGDENGNVETSNANANNGNSSNVANGYNDGDEQQQEPIVGESMFDKFSKMSDDEWIRGEKPPGLEERCLKLCRTYIAGCWITATPNGVNDIEVIRIAGGLTNQLYRVRLRDTTIPKNEPNEPVDVAIKLFQPKHMKNYDDKDNDERLTDIILLTIMSQTGLGPKVYGIFNDGFIQAYHEHEQFRAKHQRNPVLLRKLVRKLARLHHLHVPINKKLNFLFTQMYESMEKAKQNDALKVAANTGFDVVSSYDFLTEMHQMEHYFSTVLRSKHVLCHNDFRGSNMLVIKNDNDDDDQADILLVDLEYSTIDNRAQDFVTFLVEWGCETKFNFQTLELPSREVLVNFFTLYQEECEKLCPGFAEREENSVDEMIRECRFVLLAFYLYFMAFMLQETVSFIDGSLLDRRSNFKYIKEMIPKYEELKRKCIEDGLLPNE